jgi:two-component system NtrC family sensor kinase
MNRRIHPAELLLLLSLALIFLFLIIARPSLPFLALLLIPIALAAVLYEFVGGILVALIAMIGAALFLALDPDAARRSELLQEGWPILVAILAIGPLLGYFVARERERERQLADTTRREQERAQALVAISEAGRQIAASHDLDRTLQLVMTKAAETLPMDAGALFVFDESTRLYRVVVSHNLPPEQVDQITFAFDEGVPGWVLTHRQSLIISDARLDDRVHPNVVAAGVLSVLATPLITRERAIGVLNLFHRTGVNAFDQEDLRLAEVYADQAAISIENARLLEELRQGAAELEERVEQRTRELRETQVQVIRAEKMAAVGRLAASVAHEVNNPLQAIALHLQLIADDGLSDQNQEQITILQQELARIAKIVQRLLEFQRPKHGRRSAQDVLFLLEGVLALAGKQLQQNNVSVTWQVDEDLPPILAAGDQVKQVFLNLVLNAAEAMPGGGELTIHGAQSAADIIITFSDTGPGIAPEDMAQIFEPFFSTKSTGTGIGLAVSREIVTNHGGILQAQNHPQKGAIFTVTLPTHPIDETATTDQNQESTITNQKPTIPHGSR